MRSKLCTCCTVGVDGAVTCAYCAVSESVLYPMLFKADRCVTQRYAPIMWQSAKEALTIERKEPAAAGRGGGRSGGKKRSEKRSRGGDEVTQVVAPRALPSPAAPRARSEESSHFSGSLIMSPHSLSDLEQRRTEQMARNASRLSQLGL